MDDLADGVVAVAGFFVLADDDAGGFGVVVIDVVGIVGLQIDAHHRGAIAVPVQHAGIVLIAKLRVGVEMLQAFVAGTDADGAAFFIQREAGVELQFVGTVAVVAAGMAAETAGDDQRPIAGDFLQPFADRAEQVGVFHVFAGADADGDDVGIRRDAGVHRFALWIFRAAAAVAGCDAGAGGAVAVGIPLGNFGMNQLQRAGQFRVIENGSDGRAVGIRVGSGLADLAGLVLLAGGVPEVQDAGSFFAVGVGFDEIGMPVIDAAIDDGDDDALAGGISDAADGGCLGGARVSWGCGGTCGMGGRNGSLASSYETTLGSASSFSLTAGSISCVLGSQSAKTSAYLSMRVIRWMPGNSNLLHESASLKTRLSGMNAPLLKSIVDRTRTDFAALASGDELMLFMRAGLKSSPLALVFQARYFFAVAPEDVDFVVDLLPVSAPAATSTNATLNRTYNDRTDFMNWPFVQKMVALGKTVG